MAKIYFLEKQLLVAVVSKRGEEEASSSYSRLCPAFQVTVIGIVAVPIPWY
jgi:hypothetical protein